MKILTSGFEVHDSGVITSPDLSEIRFVVSENPRMDIICRVLIGDQHEKGISVELAGENALAIVIKNPSGISYGPAIPMKVGTLQGRPLYVSFRITLRGDNSSYGLEYTFYLKDKENS